MDIGSIIGIAGMAHEAITGIKRKRETDTLMLELQRTNRKLEKLSDHIYYLKNSYSVVNTEVQVQQTVSDFRFVRQELEPIQQVLGCDIISSSMISTPPKMQQALQNNPKAVLDYIMPIGLASPHPNPEMVPLLFEDSGQKYLGWQMKGVLPILFNCQYNGFDFTPEMELSEEAAVPQLIPPKAKTPKSARSVYQVIVKKPTLKKSASAHLIIKAELLSIRTINPKLLDITIDLRDVHQVDSSSLFSGNILELQLFNGKKYFLGFDFRRLMVEVEEYILQYQKFNLLDE